jgi:hypothetical protein
MKQTMEEKLSEIMAKYAEKSISYEWSGDDVRVIAMELLALRDQELLKEIEGIKSKNHYFKCDNCNAERVLTDVSELVRKQI